MLDSRSDLSMLRKFNHEPIEYLDHVYYMKKIITVGTDQRR